jgi:arabinan endo-1,5-alpha-L-arabinosidase
VRQWADSGRYSIQVGRSLDVSGPYLDKENVSLAEGGGSIIYGSNHDGQVYAPGSSGVISSDSGKDVLYYHYCEYPYIHSEGADWSMLKYFQ